MVSKYKPFEKVDTLYMIHLRNENVDSIFESVELFNIMEMNDTLFLYENGTQKIRKGVIKQPIIYGPYVD